VSVTPDDVRHVAQLARLGLKEGQLPALVAELNGILQHMQVLSDVKLDAELDAREGSIDPTRYAGSAGMPLRDDIANVSPLSGAEALNAPALREGFFLVPRLSTHGPVAGNAAPEHATTDDEDDA
jgi:aspartyl-tRNA(Asn)/glutamyl-tRNA(Gln) amidotransferase subunit C